MAKRKSNGSLRLYKTYMFKDKDPIIDMVRTVIQDEARKSNQSEAAMRKEISLNSNVSTGTLSNWFHGSTKRPQFATLNATLRSMGKELTIVPKR